jgi:hypothetical protein
MRCFTGCHALSQVSIASCNGIRCGALCLLLLLLCRDYKKSEDLVMKPKPPAVLDMLFERGRRDALAWAQHVGLAALLPAAADAQQSPGAAAASAAGHLTNGCGDVSAAAKAADAADVGKPDELLSAGVLLQTPPGELPLMLPVPGELQHML